MHAFWHLLHPPQRCLRRWGRELDEEKALARVDKLAQQRDALESIVKRFEKRAAKKSTDGAKKKSKKPKLKLGRGVVA